MAYKAVKVLRKVRFVGSGRHKIIYHYFNVALTPRLIKAVGSGIIFCFETPSLLTCTSLVVS